MITKSLDKNSLKQSQDFTSYSFGIKESGLAHIFNVLRNQLYSDKILAVIREYSANALDAHAEVGKQDTPIEVSLPTKLNLNLEVRDFGRGLTEKEIGEIYAMYGESTKRGTNEQIGQLGLGSKSGFAYGDNFMITSWVNGKKTIYNAFLDPSKIGRIAKMQQHDSDEPHGVKITIPVKVDDAQAFREKAFNLFERFMVTPTLLGVSQQELECQVNPKVIMEADDKSWQILYRENHYNNESFAVMGNIAYPIDRDALNLSYDDIKNKFLQSCAINLHIPIGDLEVAASREALQYTDETIAAILRKLDKIIFDLPKILSRRFNECETLWDAKKLFAATFSIGGFGYHLNSIIKKERIKWKGIAVSNTHFSFLRAKDKTGFSLRLYGKPAYFRWGRSKGNRVKREDRTEITFENNKNLLIVEDDLGLDRGQFNKIAPLLEYYTDRPDGMELYDAVYLINFGKDKKELINKTHFDAPMKKLSELPHVKLTTIYPRSASANVNSHGVTADKKKHQSLEFTYDYNCNKGAWHSQRSAFFKAEAVNLDKVDDGIYVELDKFWVNFDSNNKDAHPHSIGEFMSNLKQNFGIELPKIYGFKAKSVNKVSSKKNWITLSDWAHKQITNYLEENNYSQLVKDTDHFCSHHSSCVRDTNFEVTELFALSDNFDDRKGIQFKNLTSTQSFKKIIAEDSLLKEYLEAWNEMKPTKEQQKALDVINNVESSGGSRNLLIKISDKIDNSKKPTHDLFDLANKAQKRYPLLSNIDYNFWDKNKIQNLWTKVAEYVNLIDITVITKNRK